MGNLWQVNEESFSPNLKQIRSQETVFTIGNGYFCTRGTFEEGYPHETAATLLFGVFDSVPVSKEELANAPDWVGLQLFVNGERFRLDKGKLLAYTRSLNLQNGLLTRTVHWESPLGVRVRINSERFASLADEHLGMIRYSVTIDDSPKDLPVAISLRANFNAARGNYDVMHWETTDQGHSADLLWLQSETRSTHVTLVQSMSFNADTTAFQKEFVDGDIEPSIRLTGALNPQESVVAEKVVVMYTSRDNEDPRKAALIHHQQMLNTVAEETHSNAHNVFVFDYQIQKQDEAWARFWEQTDVVIEGDEKAQVGLRYNIYQLRINTADNDSRYSIAAKGMTGFGYRGHIFHDTEIFMLPFFTYELPHIARNLLLYRYHLLPAARKKAASNGYAGAQFPWESTLNGEETTPPSIVHPETGEVIPVLNGFIELHITSSIAHATWEYWRVSADDEFMRDYGAELLLSTALFWDSRAEKNGEKDEYIITDVIGPDEWHEHVNDNAHTNFMAKHNIRIALDVLKWLQQTAPSKAKALIEQLDLTDERLAHMRDVMEHLRFPQDPVTGLIEQFDGFFKLAKFDQEKYRGRKDSYQGILGVQEVQKYQLIKQADVLMLLTMMRDEFDYDTKKVNWDYYFPITDHDYGSSLTPALHAILGCELGHTEEAYRMFMKGTLVDLENLRGNTPEGVHAACAGAVWQAAIFGFAGLRITGDGYTAQPHWPDNWQRLSFQFKHKGEPVNIDLKRS
ncbi:glycoside hydrolase family 65 protein [Dictyobacter aurantiacus]|uniref:Kojibiose phosphorylase n=1 Tax=Dictyobacter aurantiacus TaxID=1936993 RepID=A0A401Z838_9CHLR|nr:glycoside hydrolase family 65 protein [Dictyobacter aurantiacus]GCE03021.1 kojibiose phosphorylase [Dictyobacter aurantiacus]